MTQDGFVKILKQEVKDNNDRDISRAIGL